MSKEVKIENRHVQMKLTKEKHQLYLQSVFTAKEMTCMVALLHRQYIVLVDKPEIPEDKKSDLLSAFTKILKGFPDEVSEGILKTLNTGEDIKFYSEDRTGVAP